MEMQQQRTVGLIYIDVEDNVNAQNNTGSPEGPAQQEQQNISLKNGARMLDGTKQTKVGSLREVQEPTSRRLVTEENVLQPSSKLPWTCHGYSLRGPAHDPKEKEVTGHSGHPLRYAIVEEPAGGRTMIPSISETLKEVNRGSYPLLHTPNRILQRVVLVILIVLGLCIADIKSLGGNAVCGAAA